MHWARCCTLAYNCFSLHIANTSKDLMVHYRLDSVPIGLQHHLVVDHVVDNGVTRNWTFVAHCTHNQKQHEHNVT